MNWTGGTRMRYNRPSSDTTRVQKRYFARVRAAQHSASALSHASSSSVLGDGDLNNNRGKRKKTTIPTLDIILPRDGYTSSEVASKKRKVLDKSCVTATPLPSIQSSGNGKLEGNELKTKKQLLLEKDDWVCTTLARPLVLKHQADVPRENKRAVAGRVKKPRGLSLQELFATSSDVHPAGRGREAREYNPTGYPSLERRTYLDTGDDGGRRFGGAFRNLSDGGYVQIGGSTQFEGRTATPQSIDERGSVTRQMSDASEETMLFDLDGRQEGYGIPSRLPPSPAQLRPGSNESGILRGGYQIAPIQDGSEDMGLYQDDPRWGDLGRGGHVANGFPSSPLAPYSQNFGGRARLTSNNRFLKENSGLAEDLIEEIEEVAGNSDPSSPSTVLSTIYLRQDLATPSQISAPHIPNNYRKNLGYQTRSHGKHLNRDLYRRQPSKNILSGLNHILQEEIEGTQNLSLIANISSSEISSAAGDGEGDSWMLGSNISPQQEEELKSGPNVLVQDYDNDWETFLNNKCLNKSKDMEQEGAKDDMQRYLDGVGIWEKQPRDNEEEQIEDQRSHNILEEHEDLYQYEHNSSPAINIQDGMLKQHSGYLPETRPRFLPEVEEEGNGDAPRRDFVTGPLNRLGVQDPPQRASSSVGKPRTVDRYKEPFLTEDMNVREGSETENPIIKKLASPLGLDLDREEDRAWRMFVFDGLDDKPDEEEFAKVTKPPKLDVTKRSSPKPTSQFLESQFSEPQLPSPPQLQSSAQNFDIQSTAGATAGSESIVDSGDTSIADSSSPVKVRSKYFNVNHSSSPVASPVSLVQTIRPRRLEGKSEWKGGKKSITSWLGTGLRKKRCGRSKGMKVGEIKENGGEDEIDEIEEW